MGRYSGKELQRKMAGGEERNSRLQGWSDDHLSVLMEGSEFKDEYRDNMVRPLVAVFVAESMRNPRTRRRFGNMWSVYLESYDTEDLPDLIGGIRSNSMTSGITRPEVADRITRQIISPDIDEGDKRWRGARQIVKDWVDKVSDANPPEEEIV